MYFISNSMPKSASTLLCELTRESVIHCFGNEGQIALYEAIKVGKVPGVGGFVSNCSHRTVLDELRDLSKQYGPFVAKAHVPLTQDLQNAIARGDTKVSYIFRDPRDAMLSAMSNYNSTKNSSKVEFKGFESFDSALTKYINIAKNAVTWKESGLATILRYEEFINDIEKGLEKVLQEFGLIVSRERVSDIVTSAKLLQKQNGWNLRFNKGISGRFRLEMMQTELDKSTKALEKLLTALEYTL